MPSPNFSSPLFFPINGARFTTFPNIAEVEVTVELCQEIGTEVHWDRAEGVMEIITKELKSVYIPQRFSGSNRIPILMIGALLGTHR